MDHRFRKISVVIIALLLTLCTFAACAPQGSNPAGNEQTADPGEATNPVATPLPTIDPDGRIKATYEGVDDAANVTREQILGGTAQIYKFTVDGEARYFTISNNPETDKPGIVGHTERAYNEDGEYGIQNILAIGADYYLETVGNVIVSAEKLPTGIEYTPVVSGTPGLHTLGNFLKTAVMPMGTTLYVYGGGWTFDDTVGLDAYVSIGVSDEWVRFYNSTDNTYDYKLSREAIYPEQGWNYYAFAGLDCSGYAGFVLYNTFWTELGKPSFVTSSTKFAASLANKQLGSYVHPEITQDASGYATFIRSLHPGDVISISGHVYVVVGICSDDSVVIVHSAASPSSSGSSGGGVQFNALSATGDEDCEAMQLVTDYMTRYFPEWYERFPSVLKVESQFFDFTKSTQYTGVFTWNILSGEQYKTAADFMTDGENLPEGLGDPDGLYNKSAAEVLAYIFSNN